MTRGLGTREASSPDLLSLLMFDPGFLPRLIESGDGTSGAASRGSAPWRRKVVKFRGGRNRVKLMLDGFNMLNEATILGYVSNNQSNVGFTQPNSIIPPRVFRFGASIN